MSPFTCMFFGALSEFSHNLFWWVGHPEMIFTINDRTENTELFLGHIGVSIWRVMESQNVLPSSVLYYYSTEKASLHHRYYRASMYRSKYSNGTPPVISVELLIINEGVARTFKSSAAALSASICAAYLFFPSATSLS